MRGAAAALVRSGDRGSSAALSGMQRASQRKKKPRPKKLQDAAVVLDFETIISPGYRLTLCSIFFADAVIFISRII